MTVRAYVVHHDLGFAPNPFFGYCTLATCKTVIREHAKKGDWVAGIGGSEDGGSDNPHRGRLVFAMKVEEQISFDKYFEDPRFQLKKPIYGGSLKLALGDNAYCTVDGKLKQVLECRHTHSLPEERARHVKADTDADAVLISRHFVYFGSKAKVIPRDLEGRIENDKKGPKRHLSLDGTGTAQGGLQRDGNFFEPEFEAKFVAWLNEMNLWGYQGDPVEWVKADELKAIIRNGTVLSPDSEAPWPPAPA